MSHAQEATANESDVTLEHALMDAVRQHMRLNNDDMSRSLSVVSQCIGAMVILLVMEGHDESVVLELVMDGIKQGRQAQIDLLNQAMIEAQGVTQQ